jgi:hypothetical protein
MAPMNKTRGRVAEFVSTPLAALSPNPAHPIKAAVIKTPTEAKRAAGVITPANCSPVGGETAKKKHQHQGRPD